MKLMKKDCKATISCSSINDQASSSCSNFWLLAVSLIILLSSLPNLVTIDGTFIFDDRESILKNEDVSNLSTTISQVFSHDFWGSNMTSNLSHKSYRPLTIMAFRMQHQIAGELNPRIFHIISIGLHVVNSLLCLLVVTAILLNEPQTQIRPQNKEAILLASSSFAVHPIHTESIASIVGQADMLYSLFSLVAFLIYHYALTKDKNQIDRSSLSNLKYIFAVSFLTLLSLLCKEQGLMTTVMCALYDAFKHKKDIFQFFKKQKTESKNFDEIFNQNSSNSKKLFKNFCLRLIGMTIVTLALLLLRLSLMVSQPVFSVHDNPQSFVQNFLLRGLNYCYLYWLNVWLLLNPLWLCCDWSNNCVSTLDSLQDGRLVFVLLFSFVLLSLAVKTIRFWNSTRSQQLLVAYVFLFVPFLPASNIFFRVGFVIAERNLYLPCLGFSLIVAIGYSTLLNSLPEERHLSNLRKSAIFLIVIFSLRSHMRNKDWLQSDRLFRSGLKVCPNNAKLYFNIGMAYLHQNNLKPAKDYFYETIRKNPSFASAYNGLGDCFLDEGNLTLAEEYFLKAINLSGVKKEAPLLNLCYTRFKLKKMAEARDCIKTIIKEYPSSADRGYYGLGEIFYHSGNERKALESWINATQINCSYTEAWESVIVTLYNLGERKESERMFHKSVPLVSNPAALHCIWARLHEDKHYLIGEEHFKKALSYEPNNSKYRQRLVSFYKKWKRENLAEEHERQLRR